jgi:hypothetical protein
MALRTLGAKTFAAATFAAQTLQGLGGSGPVIQVVSPSGATSAEAFGSARLDLNVTTVGSGSAETFGIPDVRFVVSPSSITSAEAFGTARLDLNVTAGAGDQGALGTPRVDFVVFIGAGAPSGEAFGAPSLAYVVLASGIPGGELVPTPAITTGPVDVRPVGIPPGEVGTPTYVLVWPKLVAIGTSSYVELVLGPLDPKSELP